MPRATKESAKFEEKKKYKDQKSEPSNIKVSDYRFM